MMGLTLKMPEFKDASIGLINGVGPIIFHLSFALVTITLQQREPLVYKNGSKMPLPFCQAKANQTFSLRMKDFENNWPNVPIEKDSLSHLLNFYQTMHIICFFAQIFANILMTSFQHLQLHHVLVVGCVFYHFFAASYGMHNVFKIEGCLHYAQE